MARNYLCVPFEFFVHDAAELTDEEFGRLVRGMFLYFTESKEIIPQGNEKFFTKSAMAAQDNFKKKYEETSQKRREAGQKGASKRWQAIANDSKCHQMMANDSTIVLDLDIEPGNWRAVKQLAKEFAVLENMILTEEPPPAVECAADREKIRFRPAVKDGALTLLTCNIDEQRAGKVVFNLPPPFSAASEAEVLFENRKVKIENGAIADEFAGHTRHVYSVKSKE